MWERTNLKEADNLVASDEIIRVEDGKNYGVIVDSEAPLVQKEKEGFAFMSVSCKPPYNGLNLIAIMYSFIPYPVVAGLFIAFLITKVFLYLYLFLQLCLVSAISEVFLKNIFREARPANTLLHSYGMPSSHSMTSLCVLTYVTAEVFDALFEGNILFLSGALLLVGVYLLLAPIPWARWYIEDHSLKQITVGSAIGAVTGIIAFIIRVKYYSDGPMNTVSFTS